MAIGRVDLIARVPAKRQLFAADALAFAPGRYEEQAQKSNKKRPRNHSFLR